VVLFFALFTNVLEGGFSKLPSTGFSEVRRFKLSDGKSATFSITLGTPKTSKERRRQNEKGVGYAQHAPSGPRRLGDRCGRPQLPLLRLLPA
jgi:hypothetical protein